MLSASNLSALDEAHLRFIVGARATRAPGDLEAHFHWAGDALADGELIDTITPRRGSKTERDKSLGAEPVWDPKTHTSSWRAVRAHSQRRAARDNRPPDTRDNRTRTITDGHRRPQTHRVRPPPAPVTPSWTRPPSPVTAPAVALVIITL